DVLIVHPYGLVFLDYESNSQHGALALIGQLRELSRVLSINRICDHLCLGVRRLPLCVKNVLRVLAKRLVRFPCWHDKGLDVPIFDRDRLRHFLSVKDKRYFHHQLSGPKWSTNCASHGIRWWIGCRSNLREKKAKRQDDY